MPDDEFCGLFGYNQSYTHFGFIGDSNRYAALISNLKGQDRIYIVDLDQKQIKWLNFLQKSKE